MMTRWTFRLGSLVLLLLTAAVASGQSGLDGRWQGDTDGGATLVLDLTVKGAALTGTLTRNTATTKLVDGKVSGKTFTFKATLGDREESLSGELVDGKIRIWLDRQGPDKALVLVKEAKK
jgi:hypothetical protein